MKLRKLGRTGLSVSPIGLGGAPFGYRHKAASWDPYSLEGREQAIATVHRALDRGINYIDTAPLYGAGHSESLIGEIMKSRRNECVLASKVWFEEDRQGTLNSVHESLNRLQTDHIDIVQIQGRMYSAADCERLVNGGMLDALRVLRAAGKIGFIGITTEEPWTVMPFLDQGDIDLFQIGYNFIYQAAALHFLPRAAQADVAVVSMRTVCSGVLQLAARYIAPDWQAAHDLYEVSIKFVLSDSRIHSGLIGMRSPAEVDRNADIAEKFVPAFDFAQLPRLTIEVYKAEDLS
jgi:aryl-alcohol dehydrogenase-like predicted oxidoreductase